MTDALVDPEFISKPPSSGSVVVIDTRPAEEFRRGCIPEAVNIPEFFTYLLTDENGGLDGMARFFAGALAKHGVTNGDTIVFCEDALTTGYGQSCRGYFLLKYLGHRKVHVLNGGLAAWRAAGLSLVTPGGPRVSKDYNVKQSTNLVATKEDVLRSLGATGVVLLDCRDREEWIGLSSSPYGRDFCPRKGRIPGAVWLDWYRLMETRNGYPRFRSVQDCLAEFSKVGIGTETRVIVYCFKGSRASTTLLAMRAAGITQVKNYFASWNEWSRDARLPIDERLLI